MQLFTIFIILLNSVTPFFNDKMKVFCLYLIETHLNSMN